MQIYTIQLNYPTRAHARINAKKPGLTAWLPRSPEQNRNARKHTALRDTTRAYYINKSWTPGKERTQKATKVGV